MFVACIGCVSYGVVPWICLHSVITDVDVNGPSPQLVRYNKDLLYFLLLQIFFFKIQEGQEDATFGPSAAGAHDHPCRKPEAL